MSRFAKDTSVPVERSRAEIEKLVVRYGADQFMSAYEEGRAMIGFRRNGWHVRFILPLPSRGEKQFKLTPAGRHERSPQDQERAWEQACRQRWRALALAIKAKLEAVECGITTFEDEFLAHFVLPSGQTAGNWLKPQLAMAYAHDKMPPLLPAPEGT